MIQLIPSTQKNYKISCVRIIKKWMSVSRWHVPMATGNLVYRLPRIEREKFMLRFLGDFKGFSGIFFFFTISFFSLILTPPQVQLRFVT